jgi:hypothetical protein
MHHLKHFGIIVLACLTGHPYQFGWAQNSKLPASATSAPEDTPPPIRQLLVKQEIFQLPRAKAQILLTARLTDAQIHEAVLKLKNENIATLEGFTLLHSCMNSSPKLQEVQNVPFTSDYIPASAPQKVTIVDAASLNEVTQKEVELPRPTELPRVAVPTSVEYRDLGNTLEINLERTGAHHQYFTMTVTPESRRLLGYQDFNGARLPMIDARGANGILLNGTSGIPLLAGTRSRASGTETPVQNKNGLVQLEFFTGYITEVQPSSKPPPDWKERIQLDPFAAPDDPPKVVIKSATSHAGSMSRLVWEVFSMPRMEAFALLHTAPADGEIYAKLRDAVQAEKAVLETLLTTKISASQRILIRETEEFSYPSDMETPHVPESIQIAVQEELLKKYHGNAKLAQAAFVESMNHPAAMANNVPTTFEYRNLGDTLEVHHLTWDDDSIRQLDLAPERITLKDIIHHAGVPYPIFQTQKFTTSVNVQVNVPLLVGTLSPAVNVGTEKAPEAPRVWVAFVTVFDSP